MSSERSDLLKTYLGGLVQSTLKPKQLTLTGETVCLCVWLNVCVCDGEHVGARVSGDLHESVRKVPERSAVGISPRPPRPTGGSTESLWLVSIKGGQPLCEFMVSPYSPSHLLVFLFPSNSLSYGEATNSFQSSLASKPSRSYIRPSVLSQTKKNKLCIRLTL